MRNKRPSSSWALPLAATLLANLATATPQAQKPTRPPIDLRAQVVDVNGTPIKGAGFLFSRHDTITTQRALATPMATTDEKGMLAFTIWSGADDSVHFAMITSKGKTSVRIRLTGPVTGKGEKRRRTVDLGLIVLRKGVTIRGLVRSKQGKPIPGARVRATDIFRTRHLSLHIAEECVSWATTDESGKFKLAGVPDRGASVRITARGFHDFEAQHANQFTPVVVQLEAGGTAQGVVIDAAGKPAAGLSVRANFEQTETSYAVNTDEKGRFAVPLRFPGRYRLMAAFKDSAGSRQEWTGVFSGSQSDVRIQLPADRTVAKNTGLRIRVKAKSDGKTITNFKGVVVWISPQTWKHNTKYLSQAFDRSARSSDAQHELVLPGPKGRQPDTGRILVKAKGYASTFKDVEANDTRRAEIEVQLDPEAVIEGVVVDQKTGKPIEGAEVRVIPNKLGQEIVKTDASGRFRVSGLSQGMHSIVVSERDRPDTNARGFKLTAGQVRKGFDVKMPRGITYGGRLFGTKIGTGWRVKLERRVEQQSVLFPTSLAYGGPGSKGTVLVTADGKFRFTGVTKGKYELTLHIPYSQGTLQIPVRTVNVRGDGEEKYDISAHLPAARLHGSVKTTGASLPPGRLLVIAHSTEQRPQLGFWITIAPITPVSRSPRALVGPSGAYDLPLRSGKYLITLVDLATGIVLYQSKTITIKKRTKRQFDIATALATVECKITPTDDGQPVLAHRVEVIVNHPKPVQKGARGHVVVGSSTFDSGKGLALQPGQTQLTIVLPALSTKLLVRSAAHMLDPKKNLFSLKPIGTKTVTPEAEKITRIGITVTPPDIELPRSN
jgi:uncharacterized GH25 family protein